MGARAGTLCCAHLGEVFGVDDVPLGLELHVRPARSAHIVLVGPLHVALVLPRLTFLGTVVQARPKSVSPTASLTQDIVPWTLALGATNHSWLLQ